MTSWMCLYPPSPLPLVIPVTCDLVSQRFVLMLLILGSTVPLITYHCNDMLYYLLIISY